MANAWGYPVIQTDIAGLVITGGQVEIVDGYSPSFSSVPSGIVRSVVLNSTGNYSIILQEAWYALVFADVQTVVADGYTPAALHAQIQEITVGDPSVLPVQAGGDGQGITFQVYNMDGTVQELDIGSSFTFFLVLKASSA